MGALLAALVADHVHQCPAEEDDHDDQQDDEKDQLDDADDGEGVHGEARWIGYGEEFSRIKELRVDGRRRRRQKLNAAGFD